MVINSKDGQWISCTEYQKLVDAEFKLKCLEAGGVDNWQWYSEAMEPYWKRMDERDQEEEGEMDK